MNTTFKKIQMHYFRDILICSLRFRIIAHVHIILSLNAILNLPINTKPIRQRNVYKYKNGNVFVPRI